MWRRDGWTMRNEIHFSTLTRVHYFGDWHGRCRCCRGRFLAIVSDRGCDGESVSCLMIRPAQRRSERGLQPGGDMPEHSFLATVSIVTGRLGMKEVRGVGVVWSMLPLHETYINNACKFLQLSTLLLKSIFFSTIFCTECRAL